MKSSIGSPSKEDVRRFQLMQEVGCVACAQKGIYGNPGDIHHLLNGNRRISHQHTICLCPWHHRGISDNGLTTKELESKLGPSLARSKREFIETFGDDEDLLWFQNEIIKRIEESFV